MNNTSTLDDSTVSHFPIRLWTEFVILALGLPAAIWVASKLIKLSVPAATQGSPGERFLWWITGPAIAEWLFVLGVVFVLRHRQLSLKDIGVWRVGNWRALCREDPWFFSCWVVILDRTRLALHIRSLPASRTALPLPRTHDQEIFAAGATSLQVILADGFLCFSRKCLTPGRKMRHSAHSSKGAHGVVDWFSI